VGGSGDNATAVGLYSAIVTALYRRERTGKGSYVTTSLLAEGVWSASVAIQAALVGAKFSGLHDRTHPANAALNVYRAADGTWFVLIVAPDKLAAVAKAFGRPDILTDPRFSDPAKLTANMPQLAAILDEVFGAQPMAHWYEVFSGLHVTFGARARAARGDRRSAAAIERHGRSARRRRWQADLDDQQPVSGARRRQGAGAARARPRRAQRSDPARAGI
jgi:crotonobetainyl-CoA:carnitine CoA-transferase CaiB-like acyl-CoA transferase